MASKLNKRYFVYLTIPLTALFFLGGKLDRIQQRFIGSANVYGKVNDYNTFNSDLSTSNEGYPRENDFSNCTFKRPYDRAPVPLILMSMGRSGSSVTWDTLSTMLGSTTKAFEVTGGNKTKSLNFFRGLEANHTGVDWAIQKLCRIQSYNLVDFDNPIISGFQWKPYLNTLEHPLGIGALKSIAEFNDPPIRVLFLTRNPLDRIISNYKHKTKANSQEVPAHCAVNDEDCIKSHHMHAQGIKMKGLHKLVLSIRHSMNNDKEALDKLKSLGINHISVTYEKLYDSDNVQEWKRIFNFLGRRPKNVQNYMEELTKQHVIDAFSIAPTTSKRHQDILSNFEEVKAVLDNAGVGYLLH